MTEDEEQIGKLEGALTLARKSREFNRAKVLRVRELANEALRWEDAGDWYAALKEILQVVGTDD